MPANEIAMHLKVKQCGSRVTHRLRWGLEAVGVQDVSATNAAYAASSIRPSHSVGSVIATL
jgi:hypothetical protein